MQKIIKKPNCTLCNDSGFKPFVNPDYDEHIFCQCKEGKRKLRRRKRRERNYEESEVKHAL